MSEAWDAIEAAQEMPPSVAKTEALDLIARRMREQNRPREEFYARFHFYNACHQIGATERKLAAYTALRALVVEHVSLRPELEDTANDVGAHLAASLVAFPQISLAQIWALLEELEAAHIAAGQPLYTLCEARVTILLRVGRLDEAAARYAELTTMSRDDGFCPPCHLNQCVWFLQRLGRDAEAIELAAPILAGTERCESVPWETWCTLLLSHRRRGEPDLARDYFARGYRKVSAEPHHVASAAELIAHAAHAGELTRGVNLLKRTLPNTTLLSKATLNDVYTAATVLCDALLAAGRKTIALEGEPRPIGPLRDDFAARARDLAAQFDRRNGNTFVSDELAEAIGR